MEDGAELRVLGLGLGWSRVHEGRLRLNHLLLIILRCKHPTPSDLGARSDGFGIAFVPDACAARLSCAGDT